MNKIITYDTLRNFTYSNDTLCKVPVKGVVLFFRGLGAKDIFREDPEIALRYAEQGIVYLVPYYNPWNWMNRQALAYTEEILDVLFAHYGWNEDLPIVSTGQSMGGLASLIFTARAKRTPKACVANCPVCDLVYHVTEREDLPRTLYSAFFDCEGSMEDILADYSPLHLAQKGEMPKADYHIFHCTEDKSVNMQRHSDRFVAEMKKNRKITYYPVLDQGHCKLSEAAWEKYYALPEDIILERGKQ